EKQARQLSYAEQKEQEKLIRKAEKAVKIAEEKIAELENTQSELEDRLATGDASSETLASYSEVKTQLDVAMEEWENAQRDYDELIASCS
ncbi:MAG: ABC transporter ATP-binding protein, partial [Muribaculaceae bacterium]|nr:ABC transporter ATP-binding protein [Muribaculaceae bacterium]